MAESGFVPRLPGSRTVLLATKPDSVQFSRSVVSNSLQPHELQHARPPCPSPSPGVHSDSCPSSPWCHPAISSSVVPQSLPASESFPINQTSYLLTWERMKSVASACKEKRWIWQDIEVPTTNSENVFEEKLSFPSAPPGKTVYSSPLPLNKKGFKGTFWRLYYSDP